VNILLHGATNKSNFGDYLYADIIYNFLRQYTNNIFFYEDRLFGISDFFRKELDYTNNMKKSSISNFDLLIYLPGGYFSQQTKSFKELVVRYFRYCKLGLYFLRKKKSIYVVGVGGAPIYSKILKKIYFKIVKKSNLVVFRDKYTREYFEVCNKNNQIVDTMDLIVSLDKKNIPVLSKNTQKLLSEKLEGKKTIMLHLHNSDKVNGEILNKIVPAINKFISKNKEYGVVISFDMIDDSIENKYKVIMDNIKTKNKFYYQYDSPWQLCSLINKIDIIMTTKLHVGVVGCVLNKSVLSFPMHYVKTKRFYEQINETERCIELKKVNEKIVLNQLNKYCDKKIKIPNSLIKKSKDSFLILDKQLKKDFGVVPNEK